MISYLLALIVASAILLALLSLYNRVSRYAICPCCHIKHRIGQHTEAEIQRRWDVFVQAQGHKRMYTVPPVMRRINTMLDEVLEEE